MLKMIIADDEPIILNGIKKLLDWEKLGIEIVGAYEDGKTAFKEILRIKPEIVLLDIQMPNMTGLEIIKELRSLDIQTNIIFISGFQDFDYAKEALKYGAVDYLIKPILKDELIRAFEKIIVKHNSDKEVDKVADEDVENLSKLVITEKSVYNVVCTTIIFKKSEDESTIKLVKFAVYSYLEKYFMDNDLCTVITKSNDILIIFQNTDKDEIYEIAKDIHNEILKEFDYLSCFIIGKDIDSMGRIPEEYTLCKLKEEKCFFSDYNKRYFINTSSKNIGIDIDTLKMNRAREHIFKNIIAQDKQGFEKSYYNYVDLVHITSNYKKEDACYYMCTLIKDCEKRLEEINIKEVYYDVNVLLELGRGVKSYNELAESYLEVLSRYFDIVQENTIDAVQSDIQKIKRYIEEHYAENITLEVLAQEFHMNSYYFSSYFKKNTGENFKVYLNEIRLKYALNLLLKSNDNISKVASRSGFSDIRSFNTAFQKKFGEKPSAYRKKYRQQARE